MSRKPSRLSKLLDNEDLAAMINVNVRTIVRRRAAGTLDIPVIDIAPPGARTQPRYRLEDVRNFLNARHFCPPDK